jgi:hypothetical protein
MTAKEYWPIWRKEKESRGEPSTVGYSDGTIFEWAEAYHARESATKALELIKEYLARPDVQKDLIAVEVLNCLAGDLRFGG